MLLVVLEDRREYDKRVVVDVLLNPGRDLNVESRQVSQVLLVILVVLLAGVGCRADAAAERLAHERLHSLLHQ